MPEYGFWAEKLCVIYRADPVHPLGAPTEPGHRAVWITPDRAARQLGNSGDRHFVSRALDLV
jgi:8-oxo-dGTP diphosphatase